MEAVLVNTVKAGAPAGTPWNLSPLQGRNYRTNGHLMPGLRFESETTLARTDAYRDARRAMLRSFSAHGATLATQVIEASAEMRHAPHSLAGG